MMNNKDIDIKVLNQLLNKEQRRYFILEGISTYAFLFLIYLCKKNEVPVSSDINAMIKAVSCDDNIKSILQEHAAVPESMTDVFWNACSEENIRNLFRQLCIPRRHLPTVSRSLFWLASELLELKENDILADFTGDVDDLSLFVQKNNPVREIHLFAANKAKYKLLKLKNCSINEPDISRLRDIDLFSPYASLELKNKFTKIFACIHPTSRPEMVKAYIDLINRLLALGKKAVVVVPDCVLYSRDFLLIRKEILEKKFLTRIISLPQGVLFSSNLYTSILVLEIKYPLNRNDNSEIFLTDLRKQFEKYHTKPRFINPLDEMERDEIKILLFNETKDTSIRVDYSEIINNDYNLSLGYYLQPLDTNRESNFILLQEADILRSTIDSKEGIVFVSEKEMKNQMCSPIGRYLLISDVQENQVNIETMPNILSLNKDYAKFKLTQNDILISKTTNPVKIAICPAEMNIYPAGNFYIIRLHADSKLNRYYLKAFLESQKGQTILNNISVGATMKTISISSLGNIEIPFLDERSQHLIRIRYLEVQKEIEAKKQELENLRKKKQELLDDFFVIN